MTNRTEIEKKLKELCAQRDELNKTIVELNTKRTKMLDNEWKARDPKKVSWAELLHYDHSEPKTQRALLDARLAEYHLSCQGAYWQTAQHAVQVSLPYKAEASFINEMAEGLRQIGKVLIPVSEDDEPSDVTFRIFENSLSEYRSYALVLNGGNWSVKSGRSRYDCLLFEGKLKDCLRYISEHHWYGEPSFRND